MAKYIAHRPTWLSHENRLIPAGETFETEFPPGMKLSDNLERLDNKKTRRPAKPTTTDEGGEDDPSVGTESAGDDESAGLNDDDHGADD